MRELLLKCFCDAVDTQEYRQRTYVSKGTPPLRQHTIQYRYTQRVA